MATEKTVGGTPAKKAAIKKAKAKTRPTNMTLPQSLVDETNRRLVERIDDDRYFGRPSLSVISRTLLEIAVEHADKFDPEQVTDIGTLRTELKRMLGIR